MTQTSKTVSLWPAVASTIALGLALSLSACSEQTPQQLVEAGKARLVKKDFKGAVIEFKNALAKDAAQPEVRFLLAKALLDSGDPRSAWVELAKAKDMGYSKDELTPVMARALVTMGLTDKLIADFGNVQLSKPAQVAELKSILSIAYGAKGRYGESHAAAEEALKADPDNLPAKVSLAWLALMSGDKNGALAQVDALIKAHPEAVNVWAARAEMLMAVDGDPTAAIAAYREALRLQPDAVEAHLGIVKLLWRQRDYPAVEKQLEELNKARPNSLDYRYYQALLALERKDLKSAKETVQQLLKAAPQSPRFLHLAGLISFERGDYAEAIAHLSKAVPSSTAPSDTRLLLARAHLRAADPRKALTVLQPLLEKEGTSVPAEAYSAAADAYVQLGDAAAARRMQQAAVKANPADVRSRAALALSDINAGRTSEGLAALQSIADGDKTAAKGAEAEVLMYSTHMKAGRLDDAQRVAETVARKLPEHPAGAYMLAKVEQRRGHVDKARELLESALKRSASYAPAAFDLAQLDLDGGQPAAAVQRFERLVAADPKSVSAALALIAARARAGVSPQELRTQAEGVVKRFPDVESARVALVERLLDLRDYPAAVAAATDALARMPDSLRLQDLVGVSELAAGNLSQAAQAFGKVANRQPQSVQPLMRMVDVELARKDVPAAISQVKKALSVDPDHLPANVLLVKLLALAGKDAEALAQAKVLQTRAKQRSLGWVLQGDLLAAKLKHVEAVEAYKIAMQKEPDGGTAAKLHLALMKSGQVAEASNLETQWLGKHPDDPDFNYYVGTEALKRQQYERAEAAYRKVLAVRPKDLVSLNNVAWLMHRGGKPGAMEYVEKALAMAPDNPALLDTAAEINAAAGRLDKALALQTRAVKLAPDQAMHRLHLAQYLVRSDKKAEARLELAKLAELGKGFPGQDEVQKLLAALK